MLKNYGIAIEAFKDNTYDIMELLIESFGHYSNFSLENVAKNTLGIEKKRHRQANYKLIRNGNIDKVKENLKLELEIIEKLYCHLKKGGILQFETPSGLVDEHEIPFLMGYSPSENKALIENCDMPFTGMRLQIKAVVNEVIQCNSCKAKWRVKAVCYYGDTVGKDVLCPNCKQILTNVRTSFFGPLVDIERV